jgi:hypothetical protein
MALAKDILDDDPGQPWAKLSHGEKVQRIKAYAYNWSGAFDRVFFPGAIVSQSEKVACKLFKESLQEILYGGVFDPETLVLPETPVLQTEQVYADPVRQAKKADDETRISSLNDFLVSSGLAGRDINTVNSNPDMQNALKVLYYAQGLCNSAGVIVSEVNSE